MPYSVSLPDGTIISDIPDDMPQAEARRRILLSYPQFATKPDESKSGFIPALQAGFKGLKSDAAALAAKTGLMDVGAAEEYIAKQKEESAKIFQPTEDEWTESPWKKLKELAGGSAAYMAAPAIAGAATLALPATIAPAVATGIGMGLTGLVSGAQFTGSNLTRQMEEGSSLANTELGPAALAAIPQAALDVLSLKMIPGVRGIFGAAGKKMTVEEAEAIATQGLKRTAADYVLSTGKTMGAEGLNEAAQQVFERLQAGLSLTDEKAQKEYLDNFLGGAALGGAMAPVGRYFERGREQREASIVGAMPGQRPGESLADAAQRLKNEIDAEKLNLIPPPAPPPPPVSPILNEQDLNNLPYGQIPAYIGTLQALPQTPEIRAAIKAAKTASLNDTEGVVNDFLLKKLDEASRSLQPQADGAGDLSFLPADLSTVISTQLANSIGFVQNKSKTNIFDQIVGKDISDPEQAAAVIDILNKYKAGVKPGATSKNIDTFIESIPFFKPATPATQGTVNVGTTNTAPGGESTVLASEPGAGAPAAGVGATQPSGVVSTGENAPSVVGGEGTKPSSIEKPVSLVAPEKPKAERLPSLAKDMDAFGKAIGATRRYGGALYGRVNKPAAKAVVEEDTPGVLAALSKSKNVFTQRIAQLANSIPGLKTRINPEASEEEDQYRQTADENTIVSHTMHINQLDAMRELKPIVEQLPSDISIIPSKLFDPYFVLPKNTIIDDVGNGNHEVNLYSALEIKDHFKKGFLDSLENLEAESKRFGETRMRQSIGRVPYKRTAVAGSFNRSTNTVEIQSDYYAKDEHVLTHEYTHAVASHAIDNPTEEQKPTVRKLQKLFEHVKEKLDYKAYGLTNIHEFVSEAWSNPEFQYSLSKIPYEKTTAWSKFVDTIAQLLGIKDSNALTEAIALSEDLVTAAKTGTEAQEKEYFSKRKEAAPQAELSEVEKQDLAAIEAFKAEGPARIAQKTEQIKNIMGKMLSRMGLKDVAVKIMDDIESKKYEGSYSAKLIKVALDVDRPVRVLRHEAIHALKELGFFSDSQWNALVKQAKAGWIDTYLKTRNEDGNPLQEGEKSRYDAYMERDEFKSDPNAIIEEAIADAFGDFDTNGSPPGMLKAILNKLISLFDAIKSALQGNGIYTPEQAARQIFGKITRGELKAPVKAGALPGGIQFRTQQGEPSEQVRSGEPAVRPGNRGGEGGDGRDEEKLSVRGGRSASTGDGGGRDKSGSDTPLAGAPIVQGGGPNPELVAVAEKYAKKYGIPYKRQSEYVELNVDRAKRLAKAYLAMPNNPEDPKVKEAYADMIRQVRDQFDALSDSGYKFTFFDGETDPYDGNAWNAMRDLRANKTMAVYGTYDGYGTTGITEEEIRQNPMLADTGLLWEDQNGIERMVTANDLFRAVHDAFGHGLEGAGFRAEGEENAWQAHAKLFYGPALKALTSETRGQNSEVNYGPNGEKNRKAKVFETAFADQKIGLMPDWTWKEGISKDEPVFQELDSRKDAKMFRNAVDRVKRGRPFAFPLHVHDIETYQDARLFLSEDKESGFALIGDEIGSFFSGGGGQAYPTLRLAVEEGGRRIDAYRTKLPSVLGKAQFRPVARVEFNPEMATELWDFEKFKQFQNGNPDLVFYVYDPSFNPKGDLRAGDEAVAQTPLVEYEQAVELQVAAAEKTKFSLRGITLGTKQPDAVAFSGVHYGKARTDTLDASKYGTGLRGAEARRLETHWDNRIKKRIYFYVEKPDGTMPLPESGLGGYVYTQTFDNLAPPSIVSRLYSEARGDANTMESLIVDAGYDGYAVPKMGMMVILDHNAPVEYQGTKAEYDAKKQKKFSLRTVPLSTRGIMEANDAFARSELGLKTKAVKNRFNKVRDIAIALNKETLENYGQMNRKDLTTDDLNTISRALADEVAYQLLSSSKTGTGLGWYSNNYPKAVKKLAKRFQELETNQHARAVFSAIVAVTSNGEKVTKNISNAITLYAKLRDGKPLVAMGNRRATALIDNLKQIEVLLAKYNTDFEKELKKEVTVADMNAYLRSVGEKPEADYLANTRIPAAAIYFGPKLGAFYANLSGSEGYLTMDLWWTRTFNRMRGLLIPKATDASIDKFREMIGKPNATRDDILAEAVPLRDKYKDYGFNTELEHLVGKKEPRTKADRIAWENKARKVAGDAFDQLMFENNLEKMANTIYKNEYEMLEEAPFSPTDRKFMYDAARRTQKLLQKEKINLSLADIQAALWYYEKRLYGKLSGKKADDIGYEEAIIKQSSAGRGRTRPSVVFDSGVNTRNVAAGESGTSDEVSGVPTGGTEKLSLRAPNTKEFKQFFGNSKVVDESGEPLVVYHGTTKDFNEFLIAQKANRGNNPDGFYFTPSTTEASDYAEYAAKRSKGEDNVSIMPVFLNIENPFVENSPVNKAMLNQFEKELRKDNPNLNDSWIKEKLGAFKERSNRKTRWFPEIFPSISFPTDAMTRVLEAGGYDGFKDGRHWIAINANQIKSATGNIGTYSKESPDIRYSLRSTWSPSINAAINRTSVARIEQGWASRILDAISPKNFSEYRQVFLNRYNQLGVYDKMRADRMGGFGLLADASAEAAAMMSDYGAGLTAAVLSKAGGVPVYANGMTTVSTLNGTIKGPLEIFSELTKLGKGDSDIYRAYQLWAGVKRGKRLMPSATNPNGTEVNYTPADIAEAKKLCALDPGDPPGLYPEFANVQKEWIKYNNQLAKYLVDTGVISSAARAEWIKYADYIPFYRQMDDEPTLGPKLFQSLTGVKPPKKLKGGSDLEVGDFLENIIRNTQSAIQMGIKNTAGQKAVTVALSLNAPGKTDVLEPLGYISTTPDSITILVNGQKKSFRSQDRLWLQAVTSLNLPDVPFMGLFSKPAQLLRTLVTKDPGFMLANMIRDSMSAFVTSGASSVNPATTLNNFAAAIAGKSPEFQALFNAGILGGHEYSKDIIQSGNKFASDLRKTSGYKTANEKLASPIVGIWEALEKGTTASDAATRMQVYKEVLAQTGNEAEAIYRAVEVMNFNRKGNSAIVRVLTAAIPFLNARIQGLDVFYRAAFGKGTNKQTAEAIQKQFFIRGATMMAMSCMYWALTHDDDDYKKQEQETKDNYWLLPSLGIKLPIPFEVGVLFKVIPERIMARTFGKDTNKDFTDAMVRQLMNTLAFNPIPQAFKPLIEYRTNYNFFTDRPIVGQGLEGAESGYQVGPNTSAIAADIGKATGMSPLKLDQLIGGYTGTMGMYAFSLLDSIYKINGDSTDASKRFEQSPVIKRFLIDPEARGTVSAYYETKNATDAAVRTASLLERTLNFKEYGPYYRENIKLLATHEYLLDLEKSMKEFREMKLLVRASQMTPDQKRDALSNITNSENRLTSNIQTIKKNIEQ